MPADKTADAVILPAHRLGDFREGCALLAFHQVQDDRGLASGFRRALGFGCVGRFLRGAAFFAFAGFLLALAFFAFAVCVLVVVSSVLMVVLLCVECIGRHIHHSGWEGMRGGRTKIEMGKERTG
jgi:hypothetical protein